MTRPAGARGETGCGCGWCGTFIPTPYCGDDGTIGMFLCPSCDHFNLLDRETGKVSRIWNGKNG